MRSTGNSLSSFSRESTLSQKGREISACSKKWSYNRWEAANQMRGLKGNERGKRISGDSLLVSGEQEKRRNEKDENSRAANILSPKG